MVSAVMEMYGDGLERIMVALDDAGDAGVAGLRDHGHDPLETVSVHLHDGGDHLLSELSSVDVRQSLDLLAQDLDTPGEFLAGRDHLLLAS